MSQPVDRSLADKTGVRYDASAAQWNNSRDPSLFERPWLDRIRASIPPGSQILYVGCGTGSPIARYFIDHGHGVTGIDCAPRMIAVARATWPDQTWIASDMRALDLGRRFAAIIAFNSLFHLTPEDQRPMFSRFSDHLLPGGLLWFTSGPRAGEVTGATPAGEVYHASLAPDEYRGLLSVAGFDQIAFVPEDPDCNDHSLWLACRSAD